MPYLILKRDDVPNGTLQVLDLFPNTSIRNSTVDPVGQTKFLRAPQNEAPVLTAGATAAAYAGLSAWFLDNVSDAGGTKATANVVVLAPAALANGDNFTINDGENSVTFEIKKFASHSVAAPRIAVDITAAATNTNVRDVIIARINGQVGFTLNVTAAVAAVATLTLTNNNTNQPTTAQNATNAEAVADAGFTVANFAGATDSAGLTAAEAIVNAQDVLDLVGYGDVNTAAGAVTLAAINGAITTGRINAEDVTPILQILAGRSYVVPASTAIETAGEFVGGGGAFQDTTVPFRKIYDGGPLRLSFAEGNLSKFTSDTFTYMGVAGAPVAVYADDGSIYTV